MSKEQNQNEAKTLFECLPEGESLTVNTVEGQNEQCQLPASCSSNADRVRSHDCAAECWRSIRSKICKTILIPTKRKVLLAVVVLMIIAYLWVPIIPCVISNLLHDPSKFKLSKLPQDSQFVFSYAILANGLKFSVGDGLLEAATYSSSTNFGKEILADWRIFESAKTKEFKPGLLPQEEPIVDGFNLIKPYHFFTNHGEIIAPIDQLVDLSRVNSFGDFTPDVLHLNGGDYITTNLTVSNRHRLVNATHNQRVRIFVQDQDLKKGIIVSNGEIAANHPADLQIWYNGTGKIKFKGTSRITAVIYAPNADLEIEKDVMFRGAIVCRNAMITGGFIRYDEDLRSIKDWH